MKEILIFIFCIFLCSNSVIAKNKKINNIQQLPQPLFSYGSKEYTSSISDRLECAKTYYNIKDYNECILKCLKILCEEKITPKQKYEIEILLKNSHYNLGNYYDSIKYANNIINNYPNIWTNEKYRAWVTLFESYSKLNNIKMAKDIAYKIAVKYKDENYYIKCAEFSTNYSDRIKYYNVAKNICIQKNKSNYISYLNSKIKETQELEKQRIVNIRQEEKNRKQEEQAKYKQVKNKNKYYYIDDRYYTDLYLMNIMIELQNMNSTLMFMQ